MFRKQFMDELFQRNMVDIRREVAKRERVELQNIPTCNNEHIATRLENCKSFSKQKKHQKKQKNKSLTNGLRDHVEYIQRGLEKDMEKAHYNQLHKRVLELRQVVQTETKRPSLLEDLRQTLATEIRATDVLAKQVESLRAELNYTDVKHWGLQIHIEQLERSGENPLLAAKLRRYSDLLFALVTKGGDVVNMQEDVDWAETVQEDKAIKRIIRTILRNQYEIDKLKQLGKQYDKIVVKQERNQIKLEGLLASCSPNMQ